MTQLLKPVTILRLRLFFHGLCHPKCRTCSDPAFLYPECDDCAFLGQSSCTCAVIRLCYDCRAVRSRAGAA
jgi:hypothetical protein